MLATTSYLHRLEENLAVFAPRIITNKKNTTRNGGPCHKAEGEPCSMAYQNITYHTTHTHNVYHNIPMYTLFSFRNDEHGTRQQLTRLGTSPLRGGGGQRRRVRDSCFIFGVRRRLGGATPTARRSSSSSSRGPPPPSHGCLAASWRTRSQVRAGPSNSQTAWFFTDLGGPQFPVVISLPTISGAIVYRVACRSWQVTCRVVCRVTCGHVCSRVGSHARSRVGSGGKSHHPPPGAWLLPSVG